MTSACCCGTTRIAREMTMIATTKSAIMNSDEPAGMAKASKAISGGRTAIGEDQHRPPSGDDVKRFRTRHVGGFELGIPCRPAIGRPRGAVALPRLDPDRLPHVERRLRRG